MTFGDQLTKHVNKPVLTPPSPCHTAGSGIPPAFARVCPNVGAKISSSPLDGELSTHNQRRGLITCERLPAHFQLYFMVKLCLSVASAAFQISEPLPVLQAYTKACFPCTRLRLYFCTSTNMSLGTRNFSLHQRKK